MLLRQMAAETGRSISEDAQKKGGTVPWIKQKITSGVLPEMRVEDHGRSGRNQNTDDDSVEGPVSRFLCEMRALWRGDRNQQN
jgi:hypothetical protein